MYGIDAVAHPGAGIGQKLAEVFLDLKIDLHAHLRSTWT